MSKERALVPFDPSEQLNKKTPPSAVYTRPGPGGLRLSYVPWAWVAKQMNKAFGAKWSVRYVNEPKLQGGDIIVMIEVATPDGVQQAFGSHRYQPSNPNANYGDALQAATSKALRRACARWGPGLDLYLGADDEEMDAGIVEVKSAVLSGLKTATARQAAERWVQSQVESGSGLLESWAEAAERFREGE